MENPQETLKKFFTTSVAVFDCMRTIGKAFTGIEPDLTPMERLHRMALAELKTESPSMAYVDGCLAEMERIAEENKSNAKI